MRVAICITTHNRRAELARTLAQLALLDPAPDEILIVADGCTDGTADFVHTEYPHATLIIHTKAHGSVASRNAMARAANADTDTQRNVLDDNAFVGEWNTTDNSAASAKARAFSNGMLPFI